MIEKDNASRTLVWELAWKNVLAALHSELAGLHHLREPCHVYGEAGGEVCFISVLNESLCAAAAKMPNNVGSQEQLPISLPESNRHNERHQQRARVSGAFRLHCDESILPLRGGGSGFFYDVF